MGEPETLVHDFGTLRRVLEPPNQYDLSLETSGYLNKSKKTSQHLTNHILFTHLKILVVQKFESFGKDGHRTIKKCHFKFLEHLDYGINVFLKT